MGAMMLRVQGSGSRVQGSRVTVCRQILNPEPRTLNPPFCRLFPVLLVFCLLPGCGSGRPETVPVTGTISFNGGEMPGPGVLFFTNIEAAPGFPQRPGRAEFEVDGKFSAKTFEPGDGLMPGKYAVKAYCWAEAPDMQSPQGKSYLPEKYGDLETGGWELVIEPGSRPKRL